MSGKKAEPGPILNSTVTSYAFAQDRPGQTHHRQPVRMGHAGTALTDMACFRYWTNAPFLLGCSAYAINRWAIKPRIGPGFFHSHFNDLWLIPCALPPLLWLHRKWGLREHDEVPSLIEVFSHLLFWSMFLEWLGPKFVPHSVGDPWDAAAYAAGAIGSSLWWHRHRLMRFSGNDEL